MTTSWKLTLVTLSVLPLMSVATALISAQLNRTVETFQYKLREAARSAAETIRFIDTVKCFNAEAISLTRYADAVKLTLIPWARASRLTSMLAACGQISFYATFIVAFWYGNYLVNSKQMTAGDVITAFWAAFSAMGSVSSIMPNILEMKTGQVSAAFLLDLILDEEDSPLDPYTFSGGKSVPQHCNGYIKFENVSFHYPNRPDVPVLDDTSFSFNSRRLTFIIGQSGSGKSTLGSLLAGFYSVSSGQITLDGIPLNQLSLAWLRKNITLVHQRSVLFKDTIQKNITLGAPDPDKVSGSDILECIRFASLSEVINNLQDGLETNVGIGGSSLSGGEIQRLALARARLRDPPILILDEPTSALDFTTRNSIMKEIREWRSATLSIYSRMAKSTGEERIQQEIICEYQQETRVLMKRL
ncbi:hypothetical protein KEM56_002562 [Ascosphaera pollenicola]|nr:hypothetical protein KEM56_002562 [Ascosphaera pollenicola]